jgi:8-oxo-dGTP pyrophosphatase MutT (NUDIX family)
VIVHKDGKVFLQLRKNNGCWGYHGGCVEFGESIEETAKRELFEETGLTAISLELLGIFSGEELFYTYPNGDMVAISDVVYLCENFSSKIITETNETTDLRWFEIGIHSEVIG